MIGGLGAKDILIQLKGDTKNFKGAMKDADSSMASLTKSVKTYGPAMAAAFAVGTAAIVGMSVKMAAAEEVVNRQTESMLKSQGIMWSEVKGEVTDYINELEKLTAFGDTDLQMAFNRMSSAGMSYDEVMQSMKMTADIAYTRNISLVTAADLVSKAYNGQASSLKRYGIVVENGVTGLELLNAVQIEVTNNFADSADQTESLDGKMRTIKNMTDDTAEAFGEKLLPQLNYFAGAAIDATGGAEELGGALGDIVAWPMEKLRGFGEFVAVMQTTKDLRKGGIDTEEELIDAFGLEYELLADMNDQKFKLNMQTLESLGYSEKAAQLEAYRNYTLKEREISLENEKRLTADILENEEGITKETEKQLSLTERKAAADRAGMGGIRGRVSGTTTMSAGTAIALGLDPSRGDPRITGGETVMKLNPNKSGAP